MRIRRPARTVLLRRLAVAVLLVAVMSAVAIRLRSGVPESNAAQALATNPTLDPGTPVSGPAPGFTLTDQFGRRVSLSEFRGKVVILAFNDPVCTTVCPLTTTAMVDAKRLLGPAGTQVQLLGIAANPTATAVADVRSYSRSHEMMHAWHFLTAPLRRLKHVWSAYGIEAQLINGQIDHTPALYVIDQRGRLSRLYMTQMFYSSVGQLGQLLARSVSSLLPGRPRVRSSLSYAQTAPITPSTQAVLPRSGGGDVRLGPGRTARLFLFFDTWVSQTSDLAGKLQALNRYVSASARDRLPPLTAVDEASVEPSPTALPHFLRTLSHPLSYPVAVDNSGRIADGYEVQDEPWLVLVSATGRFLWYYDVSGAGWPSLADLTRQVRAALTHVPISPPSSAVTRMLAGSPAPLAALHQQSGQLLGAGTALAARLRRLRGYPVVVNAWASWCTPCQAEFPLFGSSSARYGQQVAFVGVDTNDSPGDARDFLAKHPVSYPSYQSTTGQLSQLAPIQGLPTTIFINRAGKVVDVHAGQYESQGTLDSDIQTYAVNGHH
jgi:cytochrome oxidase Cu insertion factor (SCO1/SenC/PrrC family)/thiol-disulfide isomerase/thioredoxin